MESLKKIIRPQRSLKSKSGVRETRVEERRTEERQTEGKDGEE